MSSFDWDWELEIQYNPAELGLRQPYDLYFFLGSVPQSPAEWRDSPSRLFEPILSHGNTTITEFRDLNGYLKDRCEKDDDVIPYLRKQLSWRVKERYREEEIEKSKLKSLKVSVYGPKSDREGPTQLIDEEIRSMRPGNEEKIEESKLKSLKISVYGPKSDREDPTQLIDEEIQSMRPGNEEKIEKSKLK